MIHARNSRRRRRPLLALSAMVAASLSTGSLATAAPNAAETPADSFSVAVVEGQTLDEAIAALAQARYDLQPTIEAVIESQQANAATGAEARGEYASASMAELVAEHPLTAEALAEAAPTLVLSPTELPGFGESRRIGRMGQLGGSLHFEGQMTITGYQCVPQGCAPASVLTHYAQWDQGYTTVRTLGKTSASANSASWTSKSVSAKCERGGGSCSTAGTVYLATSSTWTERVFAQTPSSSNQGRWLVKFTASYNGSAALNPPTGHTPYFLCSSADQVCKWQ